MKKKIIKINAFIILLSLIISVLPGAACLYPGDAYLHDLVGEWECDEIYIAARGNYTFAIRLRIDGEEIDIHMNSPKVIPIVYLYDKNKIIITVIVDQGEEIIREEYDRVWTCRFKEDKQGNLKVKVTEDYRYNGRFKGKTFYLTKISDYPEDDSLFKLPDTDAFEDNEPEDTSFTA